PTQPSNYWTSSTSDGDASRAWLVGFSGGDLNADPKSFPNAVRAVREGPLSVAADDSELEGASGTRGSSPESRRVRCQERDPGAWLRREFREEQPQKNVKPICRCD